MRFIKGADMKERKTMDVVLFVIAVFLAAFVVAMLWLYYATGGIPDTLCTCVFAACGGECGVMGWIKTTKDRQRERSYELDDREKEQGELKVCGFAVEAEPEEGDE